MASAQQVPLAYHSTYNACFMGLPVSSFVSHLSFADSARCQFAVVLRDGFLIMFVMEVIKFPVVIGLITGILLVVFFVYL